MIDSGKDRDAPRLWGALAVRRRHPYVHADVID
jgi:hypothetical protein